MTISAICKECGAEFTYLYKSRKRQFCSRLCAVKKHNRRLIESEVDRFWSRVAKGAPDECWPWQYGTNSDGYGNFKLNDGSQIGSHRFSWSLENGPIPDGMHVLHSCDNPPCVNQNHLFLGNQEINVADMMSKGRGNKSSGDDWYKRQGQQARGERIARAIFTESDVISIRAKVSAGQTVASLAREMSVNDSAIRHIVKRRSWKHVP